MLVVFVEDGLAEASEMAAAGLVDELVLGSVLVSSAVNQPACLAAVQRWPAACVDR